MLGEYRLLKEEAAARRGGPSIIGDSPALRQVMSGHRTRRRHRHHGAARRRKRHRQGAVRAGAAQRQPPRQRAVRGHQLRGHSREPARSRAVRLRARRVHRRAAAQDRQVRDGAARHHLPRRDRRDAARAAGEDAARDRDQAHRAARRQHLDSGRRPHRGGDQPDAAAGGGVASVPRGSVFPAVGVPGHDSAAARAQGRHSEARASLRRARRPRRRQEGDAVAGSAGDAGRTLVARQRARAAECDRARRDPGRRRPPAAAAPEPGDAAGVRPSADPWDQLDWSGSLADVSARFATEAEKRKIALAHEAGQQRQGPRRRYSRRSTSRR